MCQHLNMKGKKPCSQKKKKGKKLFLKEPESDFSENFEECQLLGSLLRQHEARGHWPCDKGCDSCVQARGRTPARSRHHEGGDDQSPALTSMAADFTFVAGKYWRILVILMIHTGMVGMVVITGDRENDMASVLNEVGVGGTYKVQHEILSLEEHQ